MVKLEPSWPMLVVGRLTRPPAALVNVSTVTLTVVGLNVCVSLMSALVWSVNDWLICHGMLLVVLPVPKAP